MILTGFTDEASSDVLKQIQVTKELGWQYLSARTMGELTFTKYLRKHLK